MKKGGGRRMMNDDDEARDADEKAKKKEKKREQSIVISCIHCDGDCDDNYPCTLFFVLMCGCEQATLSYLFVFIYIN